MAWGVQHKVRGCGRAPLDVCAVRHCCAYCSIVLHCALCCGVWHNVSYGHIKKCHISTVVCVTLVPQFWAPRRA